MKFTINGMIQKRLIDLGLDLVDAELLSWFSDFTLSGKMKSKTVDGKTYFWVMYGHVIEELPILGIADKGALARRFKKMTDAGVLSHLCVKDSEGTFSYYGGGPEWSSLTSDTPPSASKDVPPLLFEADPVRLEKQTKDSPTNDSPIINKIQAIVSDLNEKSGKSFRANNQATQRLINARLREGFTVEDFKAVHDYKAGEWKDDPRMCEYLRPSTLYSPSKFESYLQQAKNKPKVESLNRVSIDRKTGQFSGITDNMLDDWALAFPDVDVALATNQISAWIMANPSKKIDNVETFILSWLGRDQDKANGIFSFMKRSAS